MNLNADLAVLSACNTGMGKISTFDGVISLAKAFENAGVHSTVMSLWPAQDESTAQIMASFYKYLAEGKTKSNALRLAKIDYLNSSSGVRKGPFFWASFIVQGDNSPIPQKNRSYWWVAIVVGLLGIGYFAFSKVKSKA
jgi:CHAT domain-containing protein